MRAQAFALQDSDESDSLDFHVATAGDGGSYPKPLIRVLAPAKQRQADERERAGGAMPIPAPSIAPVSEADQSDEITIIKLPVYVPVVDRPNESFAALQEWEGVVIDLGADDFTAELYDITGDRTTSEDIAVIPRSELSEDQNLALYKGLIFRWAIGFTRKATGRRSRTSSIYFRRRPAKPSENSEPAPLVFE